VREGESANAEVVVGGARDRAAGRGEKERQKGRERALARAHAREREREREMERETERWRERQREGATKRPVTHYDTNSIENTFYREHILQRTHSTEDLSPTTTILRERQLGGGVNSFAGAPAPTTEIASEAALCNRLLYSSDPTLGTSPDMICTLYVTVYVYLCTHACMYVYLCTHACIHSCINKNMHGWTLSRTHATTNPSMRARAHTHL